MTPTLPRGVLEGLVAVMALLAAGAAIVGTPAASATLAEAVALAIETNPEIGQASANREAVDFELRQARGLYRPQIDLEASGGAEWTDSPVNRSRGEDLDTFYPSRLSIVLQQLIFDGFATDSEVERQASRVDAAAYRVLERAEFIGLDVAQSYLDVMRQMDLIRLAGDNVAVHRQTLNNVRQRRRGGRGSIADVQQAEVRLRAAETTLVEIERTFEDSRITYRRLVGEPAGELVKPAPITGSLPINVESAVDEARDDNPTLLSALSDLDSVYAEFRGAEANFYPRVTVESSANFGNDVGGLDGRDDSYNVLLVARYNLYRGGIDAANRSEQIRRVDEARQRLLALERDVEELVRQSWNAVQSAGRRLALLEQQVTSSEQVRGSYRQQFTLGQRTLLDVLDSENELFNTRVDRTTTEYARLFAQYRLVASTGNLLPTLAIVPPVTARATARRGAGVPPTPGRNPRR